MAVGEF